MHSFFFLIFFAFLPRFSLAVPESNWDKCIDQSEFSFESGLGTRAQSKISKKYCVLKIIAFGIKSEKYEIDVCAKPVQISYFSSIEDTIPKVVRAMSGNCERPLFGADTAIENSEEGVKYERYKKKIWELFSSIEQTYGIADSAKVAAIQDFGNSSSDMKLSCSKGLLEEYLNRCKIFEGSTAQKIEEKRLAPPAYLPPGVHPETIHIKPQPQ